MARMGKWMVLISVVMLVLSVAVLLAYLIQEICTAAYVLPAGPNATGYPESDESQYPESDGAGDGSPAGLGR